MATLGERLANGDVEAFAELYDSCAAGLHRWLTVRLGSQDLADEALQETFVRLTRMRRRLRGVNSPTAYAFRVAQREAWRLLRQHRRERARSTPLEVEWVAQHIAVNPTDRELAEWVSVTLARLREAEREVVELKTYGQLTFREIAQVTGTPQGTVATRYRTAIDRMRGWMEREQS